MSELPPLSVLDDELLYEPDTGILRWKRGKQGRAADLVAGYVSNGYRRVHICGRSYQASRIAFAMFHRRDIVDLIDHVDGDGCNNRIENLREATPRQNMHNKVCRGYQRHPKRKKNPFVARIKVYDCYVSLGSFPTEDLARSAYIAGHKKYFGEFSGFARPPKRGNK